MNIEQRIIYYKDEINDEFANDNIVARQIDGKYRYLHENMYEKITHFFWYRVIALPVAMIYMKLHFRHKIVNRSVLKRAGGNGYFMYGNHTHSIADAFVPTIANFPTDVAVIVHPNNVSMHILGKITPYLGALPLPDDMDAARNFMHALQAKINKKKCVMIYPEAHIWPFYTDIRPFSSTSFRYPVQYETPVFCITNTYKKRKFSKKPRMVSYIDGPFYPDKDINTKDNKEQLRELVYSTMKKRSLQNEVKVINYIKVK